MAIALVSSPTTGEGNAGAIVINKPANVVDGHVLYASILINNGTITNRPAGWTNLASLVIGAATAYLERRVVSGDGANWSWTLSGFVTASGVVVPLSGVNTTTPEDSPMNATESSNGTVAVPGATVTAGAWFLVSPLTNYGLSNWAVPSGWTADYNGTPGTNRLAVMHKLYSSAGATGSQAFTTPDNGNNIGAFGAFIKAAGGGDTTPPNVTGRVVNGSTLTITYDEALDASFVPPPSKFAVVVDGSPRTVSTVSVSGAQVILTLSPAVTAGQTVTVAYTQ